MKTQTICALALFISMYSTVNAQACDVYVDNNTSCAVDIQFWLYDFASTTNCDDNLDCNNKIHQTSWINVPASTTGFLAVSGSSLPLGGWGRATIADANGDGDEEYDGYCGASTWSTTDCGTTGISVQFTRTSASASAVIN